MMKTIFSNKIYVYDPSWELRLYCQDNLVVTNPTWQTLIRLGKEETISKRHIRKDMKLYIESGNDLILPFGCLYAIWPFIKDSPYELRFNNNGQVINPKLKISMPLYDYQEDAVEKMIQAKGGVLEAAAGSGKTQIGIEIIKRIGLNALWLCHTHDLLSQTVNRIHLLYPEISVGTITEGEVKMVEDGITVSTIQTLVNIDSDVCRNKFDVVITDECFSGDIEILTDKGFKRFDALEDNEKVAQYNDDKTISYVNPIRFIKKETNQYVSFKNKNIEINVTPNHNMISLKDWNKKMTIDPAIYYINNINTDRVFITEATINEDLNQKLTTLDRIKIMLQADGCLYYSGTFEDTYKLEFSRERKIERFKELCKEADIDYKEYKKRKFDNPNWKSSYKFTIKMPKNSNNYKVLTDFLEQPRNSKYAQDIIEEIKYWDGHIRKDGSIEYDSQVKENAEFISLCSFLGNIKRSNIITIHRKNSKYKTVYRIYINEKTNWHYNRFKKELVNKNIPVYCVEVPSHKIVVKKNGFIFICGNCHHVSNSPTLQKMFGKVIEKIPARYKYGLSATTERTDSMTKSMYAVVGCNPDGEFKPTFKISRDKTNTLTAKHNMIKLYTPFSYDCLNEDGTFNYMALIDTLGANTKRNEEIVNNVLENIEKHPKQLVLTSRIEHCELLNKMLQEKGVKSVLLIGKVSNKKRKEILNEKNWDVIVATSSLMKEGIDIPELSALHWAMVISDKIATIQSAGRIERVFEGKPDPEIFDYVDVNYPYCVGKYKKRVSFLKGRH